LQASPDRTSTAAARAVIPPHAVERRDRPTSRARDSYGTSLNVQEDACDDLLEAERARIRRPHDERIAQPLVAYLDAEVESLLGE
jgi:hypothetical protein